MNTLFRSSQRGSANHGWLQAKHSFSFADWHEPTRMGFGPLRVINEDRVAPHSGFGTHGHRDMEIVTYLLDGALWHKDSMGNGSPGGAQAGVIRRGEIQRMSAGSGVMHSEMNHGDVQAHLLQIWLHPRSRGGAPGYEQRQIEPSTMDGRLALLAAPEGGLTHINSDVRLFAGRFDGEQSTRHPIPAGLRYYVHLARGRALVDGEWLEAGDALQIEAEPQARELFIERGEEAEMLVFELGSAD